MKKLIFLLLLLASCSKDNPTPVCHTCDVNVKYWTSTTGNQYYIESTTKYCDDGWKAVDGHIDFAQGTNNSIPWKRTKTTNCHE